MKHTSHPPLVSDIVVILALFVFAFEILGILWIGSSMSASVYGPMPITLHGASSAMSIRHTLQTFTSCERSANRVINVSRRERALALCHAHISR